MSCEICRHPNTTTYWCPTNPLQLQSRDHINNLDECHTSFLNLSLWSRFPATMIFSRSNLSIFTIGFFGALLMASHIQVADLDSKRAFFYALDASLVANVITSIKNQKGKEFNHCKTTPMCIVYIHKQGDHA